MWHRHKLWITPRGSSNLTGSDGEGPQHRSGPRPTGCWVLSAPHRCSVGANKLGVDGGTHTAASTVDTQQDACVVPCPSKSIVYSSYGTYHSRFAYFCVVIKVPGAIFLAPRGKGRAGNVCRRRRQPYTMVAAPHESVMCVRQLSAYSSRLIERMCTERVNATLPSEIQQADARIAAVREQQLSKVRANTPHACTHAEGRCESGRRMRLCRRPSSCVCCHCCHHCCSCYPHCHATAAAVTAAAATTMLGC